MDSDQTEEKSENDELRGLYLVPPHGELIASGKKKSIAKSRQFNLEGDWILVSGKLAYGTMRLGEPEKVSTGEFDNKYEDHLVSRRDRLRWWPETKELWLYPVLDFDGYAKPKRVEVPPGVQTVMQEVDFKQRSDDLLVKLEDLPDRFVWVPDFVSVTGSQIYAKDREPKDVDIILRAEMAQDGEHFQVPVDGSMALKLERLLRDLLGTEEVQYTANAYGPSWKSLPLYDLALVRKGKLAYVEPDEAEFAEMEYKAWREGEKRWVTLKDGRRVNIGGTASKKGEAAIREVEIKILSHLHNRERSYIFDTEGQQLAKVGGEKDYVRYNDEQVALMKDAVLSHNHPITGGSFSNSDIEMAIEGDLAEIRAVGLDSMDNVFLYRMTRPAGGWGSATKYTERMKSANDEVADRLWQEIQEGKLAPSKAEFLHNHELMKLIASDLGWDYERVRLD